MYMKLLLTFFNFWFFYNYLSFKKEDTNLFDYCYSFEKILQKFSAKSKNLSKKSSNYSKDVLYLVSTKLKDLWLIR